MTVTSPAAAAAAPSVLRHNGFGSGSAGLLTSGFGAVGVWAGLVGMFGTPRPVRIGWLLPLSGVQLDLDPLAVRRRNMIMT